MRGYSGKLKNFDRSPLRNGRNCRLLCAEPYHFVILTQQEKHTREGSQNDMVLQLRRYALRAPRQNFAGAKCDRRLTPRSVSHARTKKRNHRVRDGFFFLERAMRIELTTEAWEAPILPLNYARRRFSLNTLLLYYIFFDLTSDFNRFFKRKHVFF